MFAPARRKNVPPTIRTLSVVLTFAITIALTSFVQTPGVSVAAEPHDVADQYTLELLEPTNNGVVSNALGINDAGDVVGITRPTGSAQPQFTVFWERHGDHFHAHQLPNLEQSTFSRGFAINQAGTIVGEAFNSTGGSVPIKWKADKVAQHITGLNENGTGMLNDINDSDVAVGTASDRAKQLNADGSIVELADPATLIAGANLNYSLGQVISANGTIAGRVSIAVPHDDHFHNEVSLAKWSGGSVQLLAHPAGASFPNALDLTDEGKIIGYATVASKETPIVWDADGTPTVLPMPTVLDYTHSVAKAGNGNIIVGHVAKFAGYYPFGAAAIAWDAHGPVDLNTRVDELPAGVELQTAEDINASGQIVGSAKTSNGARAFVLTPVPQLPQPEAPQITTSASDTTVSVGETASFTAVASGEPAPTVQWEVSVDNGATWTAVAGATEATLTLSDTTLAQHGTQYRAVFSNSAGSATTTAVTLTVLSADTPASNEKPGTEPATPSETVLDSLPESGITLNKTTVEQGGTVTIQVGAAGEYANDWVAAYMFSTPVLLGGDWQQTSAQGTLTVRIPADAAVGTHRIAVFNTANTLVGWKFLNVTAAAHTNGSNQLVRTGSDMPAIAAASAALLLLAAGTVLTVARRRRRATTSVR